MRLSEGDREVAKLDFLPDLCLVPLAACSPAATETAPVAFGESHAEPAGAGRASDEVFGIDQSQERFTVAASLRAGDGGLAWCTSPSPEELRVSIALSPLSTLRLYTGGCVPPDGYYRACNDAGLPVAAPTCDANDSGKRLEVVSAGHTLVSLRDDSIDLLMGPGSDATWAAGPAERVLLVHSGTRIGANARKSVRVAAVAFKADDWQEPSEEFAEIVPNPKGGSFTFWRKALCLDGLGCMIARWEASRAGVHLSTREKDLYAEAEQRLRTEMPGLRAAASTCGSEAVLAAARLYALSRISGDDEGRALKEFDGLVRGLGLARCPTGPMGRAKSIAGLRRDLVTSVKRLLSSRGGARRRP